MIKNLKNESLKLLFSAFFVSVVFAGCFLFYDSVSATTYETSGTLVSKNILQGQAVASVDDFGYNATIPTNTTLKVQFSRNGYWWYSSDGTPDAWDTLSDGDHTAQVDAIDLSLGWAEPYFLYKVSFETTDTSATPVLSDVNLYWTEGSAVTTYESSGTLVSNNLLDGETVNSIDSFVYNLSAKPDGTGATIQFSQDNSSWYNSSSVLGGTDTLSTGIDNTIALSGLGWSGANFYYKITFTSSVTDTPILADLTVNYNSGGTAPTITAGPSDNGSSSTTPTNAGASVSFTATATDGQSDNYYLAICKGNNITANNNAPPTCDDGNWCISGSTASASQASCAYQTSSSDTESNAWYAFVCDYNASSTCSVSSQGSGDNGSPFVVNHAPSFSAMQVSINPISVGQQQTFTSTASDSDTSATVTLYACKSNDFTGSACGSAGEWCHSSATASNASCNYTILAGDGVGTKNYFGYIIDNHSFASTSNPIFGTFTISGSGSASTITINGSLKINGNAIFK